MRKIHPLSHYFIEHDHYFVLVELLPNWRLYEYITVSRRDNDTPLQYNSINTASY
ncbi:hypothetical protein [Xenorhabdus bakwenae]|uniref:hypothetical protein n=1 Tax=Xenorhabdus bakwenae TaxID=3026967 RepID=UPI000B173B55|nr:hypothetical protein [Xenorhabdus sp. SF857]